MLKLQFQYDRVVIRCLKEEIPVGHRKWDPSTKAWLVSEAFLYTVVEILYDHAPQLVRKLMVDPKFENARALSQIRRNAVLESRATTVDIDIPAPEGLEYLPFQKAGIAYASKRKSTLIADEMGLGKTIQALGFINLKQFSRVLVICPANLRLNWQREAEKWLVDGHDVQVIRSSNPATVPTGKSVHIINYDILGRHTNLLMNTPWDLLVVDEVHYVKNHRQNVNKRTGEITYHGAKRSKLTHAIARNVEHKLFLTGTPIVNRPKDLLPIIHTLDPDYWKDTGKFLFRYCSAHHNGYGWDFDGASHLEELQERLRESVMVRRLKSEVLKDLPAKVRQVIPIPAEGKLKGLLKSEEEVGGLFDDLTKEISFLQGRVDWNCGKSRKAYEVEVRKLRSESELQFSELSKARHRTALAKVPFVVDFVNSVLEEKDKVVVFAYHRDVVDALMDAFDGVAVKLVGGMSEKKKDEAVTRFQTDPKVRVFVGNIIAAGVGITLTAADTVVFAELDWVPGNISQAEDRCHRIGQLNTVNVYHIVIDKSLDARLANTLIEKQKVMDKALNTKSKKRKRKETNKIAVPKIPEVPSEDATKPAVSEEDREVVHSLLRWLASYCDGARAKDGCGYNAHDAAFGRSLARANRLTDRQYQAAVTMLQKYKGQIETAGVLSYYERVFKRKERVS